MSELKPSKLNLWHSFVVLFSRIYSLLLNNVRDLKKCLMLTACPKSGGIASTNSLALV